MDSTIIAGGARDRYVEHQGFSDAGKVGAYVWGVHIAKTGPAAITMIDEGIIDATLIVLGGASVASLFAPSREMLILRTSRPAHDLIGSSAKTGVVIKTIEQTMPARKRHCLV